jgi:ankyrin repeat protein
LLKTDSSLSELRDETGQSPLHYAVLSNSVPLVELLIDEGIDPNVKDNEGRTPLTVLEDSNLRLDAARDALKDAGGTN